MCTLRSPVERRVTSGISRGTTGFAERTVLSAAARALDREQHRRGIPKRPDDWQQHAHATQHRTAAGEQPSPRQSVDYCLVPRKSAVTR